jgi:hydroxyacylglutathione hydrolase
MYIQRIESPGLAHYSYLVAAGGKAVVIDPGRDFDIYMAAARQMNVEITSVLETHIHADYASGALELAESTGADLLLSGHDTGEQYQYGFPHGELYDGDDIRTGDLRLTALHTPGHTPEHLSFVLYDNSRCGLPMALFSGDFLFVGSVGRPDLLGEETTRRLAGDLYDSLRRRLARLDDGLEVYPAHGAGSLCGTGMAARPQTTLGHERQCNGFFGAQTRERFSQEVLGSLPPFPPYYLRMKRLNADGPPKLSGIPGDRHLGPDEVKAALEDNAIVIDLRRPEAFGGAHIPGSFNVGLRQDFPKWAAWVVPYERPIVLVGDQDSDYETARRGLVRVGLDTILGSLSGGVRTWFEAGFDQGHLLQASVNQLLAARDSGAAVLDVRTEAEWQAGHIEGARHLPAGEVADHAAELPRDRPVYVICGTGYRSSVAVSVLRRSGLEQVINVVGGMTAWSKRGLPTKRDSREQRLAS